MTGYDFLARVRLSTKDDTTLADVGETCERVPVESLAALEASGKIARRAPQWRVPLPRKQADHE